MEASSFEPIELFRSIARSGARTLLIGRRALILLGVPVLTADYDFWVHGDDILRFNDALAPLDLFPNRSPEEARRTGRYILENDEHVDVLVAANISTVTGKLLRFDELWQRHQTLEVVPGVAVALPTVEDLIATKEIAHRPKDAQDIRLLRMLIDMEKP